VNYYLFPAAVSITLKTKIRCNGREYASPAELPPEIPLAYEKALHDCGVKKRFTINGQHFDSEDAIPVDVRKLCDDVIAVIENNGEVTIPCGKSQKKNWRLSGFSRKELSCWWLLDSSGLNRRVRKIAVSAVLRSDSRQNARPARSNALSCRCGQMLPPATSEKPATSVPNPRARP